jgi:hypothetical protein
MAEGSFLKMLSANDVGATGTHQAGILVPKSNQKLLALFPPLDAKSKNPDAWIDCIDEHGIRRKFRFVYYNNELHDTDGTRNEYRLTHMTEYLYEMRAVEGDSIEITRRDGRDYAVRVIKR